MSTIKEQMDAIAKDQELRASVSTEAFVVVEVTPVVIEEELRIVESLDYGFNLLSNGSIIKKDGTIISAEDFAFIQESKAKNALDWSDIQVDEFVSLLESATYATKTYEDITEISGMSQSKMGFAFLDTEGNPFYLRSSEFSGSEKFEITECNYSQFIYNVDKNSTEEAFVKLDSTLQELFKTTDQIGSEFSPDDDTVYVTKKFIKDSHVWSIVFKNGKLSNVKQGEKMTLTAQVKPKNSKIADAINNDRFANLV